MKVTVDSAAGKVYEEELKYEVEERDLTKLPHTDTQIMMNMSVPEGALMHAKKVDGIGLMRLEFVIGNIVGIHPNALLNYDKLENIEEGKRVKEEIDRLTEGYKNKVEFYADKVCEGMATAGAALFPKPVVVRFSDFKTNEYAELMGGKLYEVNEENPMMGWRGVSRYIDLEFEGAFRLECKAMKKAREKGLNNLIGMLPFCRYVEEVEKVIEIMKSEGLRREDGFKVYLMAEVPSNVILADEFSQVCDGFSIGSNDLTQLALGIDRDNSRLRFDERNLAVLRMISHLIKTAHKYDRKVGICGEAPSNYPEFAKFLVEQGIDSISVNIDVIGRTREIVADAEKKHAREF